MSTEWREEVRWKGSEGTEEKVKRVTVILSSTASQTCRQIKQQKKTVMALGYRHKMCVYTNLHKTCGFDKVEHFEHRPHTEYICVDIMSLLIVVLRDK